jgi:hypothetical protein
MADDIEAHVDGAAKQSGCPAAPILDALILVPHSDDRVFARFLAILR